MTDDVLTLSGPLAKEIKPITTGMNKENVIVKCWNREPLVHSYLFTDGETGSDCLMDSLNATQFISGRVGAAAFPRSILMAQDFFPHNYEPNSLFSK